MNSFLHRRQNLLYCILFLLVIADRWILLEHFTFQYVDDDQSIMWYGAKEFSKGHFREPCFFGQSYNTMAESLAAVPLLWAGVSYPAALTIMMSLFTLLPFFIFSWLLLRSGKGVHALVVLAIPILLPVEFGMITAISRGVMTGVLFASLAVICLFRKFRGHYFLFGFFSMLGVYANPSSALLLFPAGLWLWMENYQDVKFYVQTAIGAVPALAIWFLSRLFYAQHPEYIVHGNWSLDMSLKIIKPYEWDKFFNHVTPVFWGLGWLIFPLLTVIAVLLMRGGQRKAGVALCGGIVLLFFSLTLLKVHHGYPSVFLSWARMFTALPVLIAVFISALRIPARAERFMPAIALIAIGFFAVKCTTVESIIQREIGREERAMYVSRIDDLQRLCDTIYRATRAWNAELIVTGSHDTKHLITYACPCLNDSMPVIIEPALDRRTWLLDEEAGEVSSQVLFVGMYADAIPDSLRHHPDVSLISTDPLMLLLRNNSMQSEKMLRSVGLPMRPH